MKKLIWLFAILEMLSVVAIGYFYWASLQPTFLFGCLIEGYEEMLICAGIAWVCSTIYRRINVYVRVKEKNKEISELKELNLELKNSFQGTTAEITSLKTQLSNIRLELQNTDISDNIKYAKISEQESNIKELGQEIIALNLKLEECSQIKKSKKSKSKAKKAKQ